MSLDRIAATDPLLPFTTERIIIEPGANEIIAIASKFLSIAKTLTISNDNSITIPYQIGGTNGVTFSIPAQTEKTFTEWIRWIRIDNTDGTQKIEVEMDIVSIAIIEAMNNG